MEVSQPRVKEEAFIQLVGGAEIGSWGREDVQQGGGWQSRRPHICLQINWEEQLGSETDHTTQGSSAGK